MGRIKVYVAGPYSKPDPCINTHRAILAGQRLWDAGYAPFVPHLTHFWHTILPQPYETWLEMDAEWITSCAVMLRLPGESPGADKEVSLAVSLGISVVNSVEELYMKHPIARE